MIQRIVVVGLVVAAVAAGGEVYRLVSDAKSVRAGADGTVLVLTGKRQPTSGAWIQDCTDLDDSLTRFDGETGAVLWSTCLPVRAEGLSVDPRGAITIVGANLGDVRATPGAYSSPGGDGIAVIRLNPSGTAPEWIATVMGNPSYPYAHPKSWTALGPDGSVYGAATVTAENLPVTEGALRNGRSGQFSAYFFRLSADGSKLLYATYVNDGNVCSASDLAADADGNVFVGGSCDSFFMDYSPSISTPGTFTTARNMWLPSAWVARFDSDTSKFHYICVFGQLANSKIALAPASRGRVAVTGMGLWGVLTPTAGSFSADRGARAGDRDSFVLLLNSEASAAEFVASYGLGYVPAIELDTDGGLIMAGQALSGIEPRSAITTTADAWRPVGGADDDSTFLLKLTADGSRVVYSTGLGCRSCAVQSLTRSADTFWIAASDGSDKLTIGAAQPVTVAREETSLLRAMPDNWSEVVSFPSPILSWDTRDPAVLSAEIRRGAPAGPVVARGTTGAIPLDGQTETYYFVDTTTGLPGRERVLGVEAFTRYRALGGIPVDFGYGLALLPNPVLSCREAPLTGTQTRMKGYFGTSDMIGVRVGAPNGPLTTMGQGSVNELTGDWVRNGMSFFLTNEADGRVYGSVRAYLLPNRSCTLDLAPQPMIRAARDCVQADRFTLAWYAGSAPVEIRQGSATGPKVARFATDVGLFDVTSATAETYWLLSWQDGGWKPIASTIADPRTPCEQGSVQ